MPASILIANDDQKSLLSIKRWLGDLGYNFLEATNGQQALDLIRGTRPDLVILDVLIPKMNGYEVCFKVKRDPDLNAIPVILITNGGAGKGRFWGRDVGANGHLARPFGSKKLKRVVRSHLS